MLCGLMGTVLDPVQTGAGEVAFQLDQIEWSDDRLELIGRWFGVRGRRFMRPALTMVADGHEFRALADLAHKPWAAEDGEPWEAAFPREPGGPEIQHAELTVAPDLTVPLPVPGAGGLVAPPAPELAPAPASAPAPDPAPAPAAKRPVRKARAGEDRAKQLDRAQREVKRLTAELERSAAALDEALAAREAVVAERDALVAERDRALAKRDVAIVERDGALTERDDALTAREEALAERDRRTEAYERIQFEQREAVTARGAALVMRDVARTRATRTRPASVWASRVFAVIMFLAVIAALLILLRGH